jgi:hypothetical protein
MTSREHVLGLVEEEGGGGGGGGGGKGVGSVSTVHPRRSHCLHFLCFICAAVCGVGMPTLPAT